VAETSKGKPLYSHIKLVALDGLYYLFVHQEVEQLEMSLIKTKDMLRCCLDRAIAQLKGGDM
jgi:hypothetical protein